MVAVVILVEATPRSAIDGSPVAVRLAGGGGEFPYHYNDQHYRAGIEGLPKAIASLDFDGEQLGGGGVAQALELRWTPESSAALFDLSNLFWTDAPITVRIGPEGAALPPIASAGLVLETAVETGALRIALADQTTDLKRAILTDRFAGTGGIEGPAALASKIKPRAWGQCFNVIGQVLDAANNIWCFGDPNHQWLSFDQVRDKGAAPSASALTLLGWQGTVAATFTALQSAKAIQGGGVVCPSIGCVKWWAQPAGDLHADIRGEVASGYVETAPEIVASLVAVRSTLTFGAGEVAAAAAARPAPCGVFVDSDSATASDLVSGILGDVSLSWMLSGGAIAFRRWEWNASTRVARSYGVTRQKTMKPVTARKLGYRRNWSPMARGDLAGIVLATDVVYDTGVPVTTAIAAAATTAQWPNVSDPTGTKPVDNATKGATIGTDVRDATGRIVTAAELLNPLLTLQTDGTLIATIAGAPTVLGKVALPDLGAATDASRRQLETDLASLSAAVAQLTAGQALVQNVFRDAGLYTDPSSGVAKLYAVESRGEQITNLSVALNAQLATISLKADVSYVKNAIATAQLPGQTVDLSSILVRLTSAETNINGLAATVQLKADATVVTGIQGTVGAVQQSLNALTATVATKASQTTVDAQGARLGVAEQTLSALDGASIAQSVTASRRSAGDGDIAGATSILDMLNGAQNAQTAADGIAQARQELGARVTGAFDAIATLSTSLAVQIGAATASLATESTARLAADQAAAQTLTTYQASIAGNLAAANTAIGVVSTKVDATAQALTDFKVQTASTVSTLKSQQTAIASATEALSQQFTSLSASTTSSIADANTALGGVAAGLGTANDKIAVNAAGLDAANGNIVGLTKSLNTTITNLADASSRLTAVTSKVDATAQSLTSLSASTTSSIADANTKIGGVAAGLGTANDKIAVTSAGLGAANDKIAVNATGLGTANDKIAVNAAGLDAANGNIAGLTASLNTTITNLADASSRITAVTSKVDATAQSLTSLSASTTSSIADANTKIGGVAAGLGTANDKITAAAAGLSTANDKIAVNAAGLDAANGNIAGLATSLNTTILNLAGANTRISAVTTKADATAQSLSDFTAQTGQNLASINQTLVAQSGVNSALSGQLSSVSTTVGGHTNTLTQYGQSINGLFAKWGVEFNANGAITGFALNNGSGRTDASFVVDNFRIVQPNGGNNRQVFSIADDGTIQMPSVRVNTLAAGSVSYDGLQLGAAQKCAFQSTGGDFAIGQNQTANVVSVTFVKEDDSSVLKMVLFANCYSPDDLQFIGNILLDGNSVQAARVNIVLDTQTSQGEMPITPFKFLTGVSAGQHTVTFTMQNTNVKNLSLTIRGGATLEVTELRKGSIGSSTGSGSSIVSSGGSSGATSGGSTSSGGTSSGGSSGGGGYSGGNTNIQ
ncbi:hypothetical protein [Sphingomonas sp. CROZ-RG-20F-R02-07]|uniref:beta strand repeat-containing protein n=1 Tax=Sphingomonas sp. CROZ-RG-20F-R02-07 TaxID=2914832 RepID=UPI001F55EA2F|nr:hypothetical protein [Sphingomonas sp. CROZ-RG-20F-R02-07]